MRDSEHPQTGRPASTRERADGCSSASAPSEGQPTSADAMLLGRKRISPRAMLALMAGLFVVVHAGYWAAGVRFDSAAIGAFYQCLDTELLRHRLAESLFYLHAQPPLFNLLLGLVLKAFPGREGIAFHLLYLLLGFGLYVALFQLLRRVGASAVMALALSTWFMLSPSFVLYEHWPFYTFPVAALLTFSALLFWKLMEQKRSSHALAFFFVLFLLCGIRSMFNLAYFVLVAVGVALLCPRRRRMVAAAALLPGLAVGLLHVKNLLVFGQATTSSWVGMNLAGTTVCAIPGEERARLVREGKLSPVAMIARFVDLESYPESYRRVSGFEGIPALRQIRKSNGRPNHNHLGYIAVSKTYMKDSLWVIRHRPGALLVGELNSWLAYFRSSSEYPLLYENLARVVPINVVYDYLFYGKIPFFRLQTDRVFLYYAIRTEPRVFIFLTIGLPLVVVYGLRRAAGKGSLTRSQRALIGYLCFTIIYVALIGNLFEVSENQRFRFTTDPLSVVLLGLLLQDARLSRVGARLRGVGRRARQR